MWIGVPRDASVCLQCRLQITRSLLRQAPRRWCPDRTYARRQSTAAAVVKDVGENIGENISERFEDPSKKHRLSKKKKKKDKLRRAWLPPRIAKLGVSSLGKPAEVLVLKDRDRHIPAATVDGAERSKAAQPRILEALQAENLPLSSDSVRQSLDQIADSYRHLSKALSGKQRLEMKKELMDGFTQEQLRSYCELGNQPKLANTIGTHASSSTGTPTPTRNPTSIGATLKDAAAEKGLPKLGKAGLVDHIMKRKWAFKSLGHEQTERHVPLATQKLEYLLNHKQSSLKEIEEQFSVAIQPAKADGGIYIKGRLMQVDAAQGALQSFCKDITHLRVRTASNHRYLKNFVTSSLLDHLTRTYHVMVAWASKGGEGIKEHDDFLSICYHKTQDLQSAMNAERTILLAERKSLLMDEDAAPQEKVSMWNWRDSGQAELVLHPSPEQWNGLGKKTWGRWASPQLPLGSGYIDPASDLSAGYQLSKHWAAINKQSASVAKILKGSLDEFFMVMSVKKRREMKKLIESEDVVEEIFAHIGKVLFPYGKTTVASAFRQIHGSPRCQLLRAKTPDPTLISPDIPALPNFLRSVAPLDNPGSAIDGANDKKNRRTYRLRYVPLTSQSHSALRYPAIEIDILRENKSGSVVSNRIIGAWAVLAEQSHSLLLPAFTVDVLFQRRLKRNLSIRPQPLRWLEEFEQQIKDLDSDEFLPFLKAMLPKHTVKDSLPQEDALGPLLQPAQPASGNTNHMKESAPKNIDYMLESWNVVHSTPFKSKQLCLELLSLEGMNADEEQQILRFARQPLLASDIYQTSTTLLLERAFKMAAHLSDSHLPDQPNESAFFATKNFSQIIDQHLAHQDSPVASRVK